MVMECPCKLHWERLTGVPVLVFFVKPMAQNIWPLQA